MQLTENDPKVGTIEDGVYQYPSLTVNGQPFNRGGGYSTRRLDDTHFIVYVGSCPDIEWKSSKTKPEIAKETIERGKGKRRYSDDSENE